MTRIIYFQTQTSLARHLLNTMWIL